MNYKSGFSLIELLMSLLIMGILIAVSMGIFHNIFGLHEEEYQKEISKLELLNTQYFLEKNLTSSNHSKLLLKQKKLLFEQYLLLKSVTQFTKKRHNNKLFIDICVKNRLCKKWVIVL